MKIASMKPARARESGELQASPRGVQMNKIVELVSKRLIDFSNQPAGTKLTLAEGFDILAAQEVVMQVQVSEKNVQAGVIAISAFPELPSPNDPQFHFVGPVSYGDILISSTSPAASPIQAAQQAAQGAGLGIVYLQQTVPGQVNFNFPIPLAAYLRIVASNTTGAATLTAQIRVVLILRGCS
jgi:hypothetical protein